MEGTWPRPETQREGKGSNGAAPEEIYFQEEHPNRVNRSSDPTGIYAREEQRRKELRRNLKPSERNGL